MQRYLDDSPEKQLKFFSRLSHLEEQLDEYLQGRTNELGKPTLIYLQIRFLQISLNIPTESQPQFWNKTRTLRLAFFFTYYTRIMRLSGWNRTCVCYELFVWQESTQTLRVYYLQAAACRLLLKVQLLDWVLLTHHLCTASRKPPVELKKSTAVRQMQDVEPGELKEAWNTTTALECTLSTTILICSLATKLIFTSQAHTHTVHTKHTIN